MGAMGAERIPNSLGIVIYMERRDIKKRTVGMTKEILKSVQRIGRKRVLSSVRVMSILVEGIQNLL